MSCSSVSCIHQLLRLCSSHHHPNLGRHDPHCHSSNNDKEAFPAFSTKAMNTDEATNLLTYKIFAH